jgi:hypothetical protein
MEAIQLGVCVWEWPLLDSEDVCVDTSRSSVAPFQGSDVISCLWINYMRFRVVYSVPVFAVEFLCEGYVTTCSSMRVCPGNMDPVPRHILLLART